MMYIEDRKDEYHKNWRKLLNIHCTCAKAYGQLYEDFTMVKGAQ